MGYGQLNYRIGRSGSVIELNDGARIQRYYPARVELGRGTNGAVRKFVNSDDPNAVSFAVKSLITNYEGDDDIRLLHGEAQFLSEAYPGYNIKFVTFNGAGVRSKLGARLVMPTFPGSNFHDALSRFPARSLEIILAAEKELQRVHDLGIIHGDIKFDNFIINLKADNTFEARLIDFGWSYHSRDLSARTTPEDCPYWAPERTKVPKHSPIVPPDASQDIYSFGFMLAYARGKQLTIPASLNNWIGSFLSANPAERERLDDFLEVVARTSLPNAHKAIPSIPPRTHTGVLPKPAPSIPPQPSKAAPIAPPRPAKFIIPFIYWKDSGKEAAKNLKPGEFLIREDGQPGEFIINSRNQDGKLTTFRIGYGQEGSQPLDSQSSQSTESVSILDISNPKSHAIFAELLTEISARLPDCKMVIPTRKEAGLLNVYSDYYSSKTAVDAYRALHSGLEQYFSSRYNLSGQEKAKSDLADKHDKLGRKLYMKGCGKFLDFQIEGFANKEQSSKQLSDMVQTLVNKAAMSSTCSAALAFQPRHNGAAHKPGLLKGHRGPPMA